MLATHEYAPFRGGVATYVREAAAAAHRLGLPVEVWTVDYAGRDLGEKARGSDREQEAFPVVRIRANGRLTPRGLLALTWGFWRARRKLRGKPVVLLSVGAQMAFFLLDLLGQRPGEIAVCFFHGSEIPRFQRNPFWRLLARRFYRRSRCFVVTTAYVSALLRNSGLLPEGAEILLAPCALPEVFHVEHSVKGDDNILRVLTVARLHPRKGQAEVARALGLLPAETKRHVIYQMVGVGESRYQQEVAAACRDGQVRCEFLGGLDDRALGSVYAQATVYAQASRTLPQSVEGFGITFLEAAVHGCPAAAWRSGGVGEAVLDGETGLLVAEGDIPGLSAIIGKLLTDLVLRDRLGERARDHALRFSWAPSAQVLWNLAHAPEMPPRFPANAGGYSSKRV